MRRLLLFLLAVCWTPCALCQQNSPPPAQFDEVELRRLLGQLLELKACRETVLAYEDFVERDRNQDLRETENWQRTLELERQATALAQRESDLARERATFYEQAFRGLTRKPGLGCLLKRIFTLGIARCTS